MRTHAVTDFAGQRLQSPGERVSVNVEQPELHAMDRSIFRKQRVPFPTRPVPKFTRDSLGDGLRMIPCRRVDEPVDAQVELWSEEERHHQHQQKQVQEKP